MLEEVEILKRLQQIEKELLFKNRQFSGAAMVHIVKDLLKEYELYTSDKDVFIKGIPIEIDLLIVKKDSKPLYGILWNADDVLFALEIKKSGVIEINNSYKINADFNRIKSLYPHIKLLYITLSESRNNIRELNKADNVYTLFLKRNGKYSSTGDYDKLINYLKELNT